jgi:hypothetical protein
MYWGLGRVFEARRVVKEGLRCFIGGLRRFVARGEDKLESTAADYALVFLHSDRVDLL